MKNAIKIYTAVILFLIMGLSSAPASAQEWSSEQKEVWKTVSDYWSVMAKGDVNGFIDYFHTDYSGWGYEMKVPSNKEDAKKWLTFGAQGKKILIYDIKPLSIRTMGDFAFVHYYFAMISESEGKKKPTEGRWTDILVKEKGKWLLVGDHGGDEKDMGD